MGYWKKNLSVLQFSKAVSISPYERMVLLLCFKMSFLIVKITEALYDSALRHSEAVYGSLIKITGIIMAKGDIREPFQEL